MHGEFGFEHYQRPHALFECLRMLGATNTSSRRLWSASEFTQNASEFPLLGFHARIYLTAQVVTDGNYKQEYVIEKFIMATFLFDFHL